MKVAENTIRNAWRTDEALWAATRAGDPNAFDQLYRRHRAIALRVAARICGPEAAEDAVQAALLSLWRNGSTFRSSRGSFRNWMLGAVRNRAIDALRAKHRRPEQSGDQDVGELADPRLTHTEVAARETGNAVREAVAELPPAQREVIALAYFGEYSQSEIASRLRIPLGTVKGRTRLAFEKLPRRLETHRVPAGAH